MAPSFPQRTLPTRSMGRGFASVDPERQREVPENYRPRGDAAGRGDALRARAQPRRTGEAQGAAER